MGLFSSSSNLSRYRVVQAVDREFWSNVQDILLQNAFQEMEDSSSECSIGWVSLENMLDSKWLSSSPFKGQYLVFALREDRKKVPPALFKKYYQLALQEHQELNEEQGLSRVSKEQQKKIKEQVQSRLLARTLPVPAVFEVVWNMQTQNVYLGSTADRVRSLFEDFFTASFRLNLEPLNGYFLARRMLNEQQKYNLASYKPAPFV